jgi:hypothetical protein
LGRKELRVSLQGRTMDDPGVSVRWQNAKAEFDEIVQLARAAEEVARKKGEGQFDAVTPPLIAYLAEAFRHETLENDHTARWSADERTLFKGVAEQLQAAGVAASSPWIGREGSRWALKARETISASLAGYQAINRHVKKVGERLAKWVRETVGITDHGIKPNHAWRHLFSTLAEEAGISERTYNAIQGHAPANVARKYGSTTVKTKVEAMALFPRFDLGV